MGIKKTGDWKKAAAFLPVGFTIRANKAVGRSIRKEAQLFRKKVVEAFNTSGASNGKTWAPNKASTIARKGSSKPLIDTGDLRKSITVINKPLASWVGVPNNKVHRNGQRMVSIAAVHEFGKVIAIPRGNNVVIIEIKERSFLRSTLKAHFSGTMVRRRFAARVAEELGWPWSSLSPSSTTFIKGKK